MRDELNAIRSFASDLAHEGLLESLAMRVRVTRRQIPILVGVDALGIVMALVIAANTAVPIYGGFLAVAVVLALFSGMIGGSGPEYGGRPYGGAGGGIAGHHAREHMGSNDAWVRAQREHKRSAKPTAQFFLLASLPLAAIGLVAWVLSAV